MPDTPLISLNSVSRMLSAPPHVKDPVAYGADFYNDLETWQYAVLSVLTVGILPAVRYCNQGYIAARVQALGPVAKQIQEEIARTVGVTDRDQLIFQCAFNGQLQSWLLNEVQYEKWTLAGKKLDTRVFLSVQDNTELKPILLKNTHDFKRLRELVNEGVSVAHLVKTPWETLDSTPYKPNVVDSEDESGLSDDDDTLVEKSVEERMRLVRQSTIAGGDRPLPSEWSSADTHSSPIVGGFLVTEDGQAPY